MPWSGLSLTILADDLTGAIDSVLPFFQRTQAAKVWVKPAGTIGDTIPPDETTPVLSVNTDTRHSNATDLMQRLNWALDQGKSADYYYKKVDSTCRGNIGQECLHLLEHMDLDAIILAPAFPSQQRQLVGGYLLLGGIPIEQTEVGRDPLSPVRQSYLPTLLKQQLGEEKSKALLDRISLLTVMKGAGPLVTSLNDKLEAGKKLIIVDAATETDLNQLALAIEKLRQKWKLMPAGSAGLAMAMADRWFPDPAKAAEDAETATPTQKLNQLAPSPTLIVAGSTMPMTRRQLQKLNQHPDWQKRKLLLALKPGQLLGLEPLEPLKAQLAEALDANKLVIISSCWEETTYENTLALARENLEFESPAQVALAVQATLAKLCEPAYTRPSLKLVVCGGHTAQTLCHHLQSQQLAVLKEIEPSVALCQDEANRLLVSKSGNFGDSLTLVRVVNTLNPTAPPTEDAAEGS